MSSNNSLAIVWTDDGIKALTDDALGRVATPNRRRARTDISAEFPHFDFSEIADGADEMWPHKETEPSPFNSSAVRVRAREMLQWIWARPESGPIAVVSHWVFLTHLLGLFNETEGLAADIGNADMRMVTLLRAPDEPDKSKEPERGPKGTGATARMEF